MAAVTTRDALPRTSPRRPVARTVAPVQDETLGSYLGRLAAANAITTSCLLNHVGGQLTKKKVFSVELDILALVSRQLPHVLTHALPALQAQHPTQATLLRPADPPEHPRTIRAACRRCMAAKGITQAVMIHARHDRNVCLRHQLWIGRRVIQPLDQVDLSGHPDIAHAQIRHNRLLRRHDQRLVGAAYLASRELFDDITHLGGYRLPYLEARDLRLTAHFNNRPWQISSREPLYHAVIYPEVITLTGMLASPHWRPFALSRLRTHRDQFHREFWRRLPTDYQFPTSQSRNCSILTHFSAFSDWFEDLGLRDHAPSPRASRLATHRNSRSKRPNQEFDSHVPDSPRPRRRSTHLRPHTARHPSQAVSPNLARA